VIAKSDLVILVVSASALAVGIVRWQINTAAPPPVRIVVPAATAPARQETAPVVDMTTEPLTSILPSAAGAVDSGTGGVTTPVVLPAASGAVREDRAPSTASPSTASPAAGEPLYGVHQVVGGDSLGAIALRFGTSVEVLREINGLDGTTILIGQRLRYPPPAN